MKSLIFLVVLAAVVTLVIRKFHKSQAEAANIEREARQQRKQQESVAMGQDYEMIWPVIVKPVTGKRPPGNEKPVEEPMMTSMEFEPAEAKTAKGGQSE